MTTALTDLTAHIVQVRNDLNAKKRLAELMLFTDPETALMIRYQIDCLEPRLMELERSARRAVKEEGARMDRTSLVLPAA